MHVSQPPIEPGSELDHVMAPKLQCEVADQNDGVYAVTLTAVQKGEHTLTVRLSGAEVIGSPFTVIVQKPRIIASTKAAGKSRGETLYAVASAIANAGINWAFKTWDDRAYERRDFLDVIRTAALSLLNSGARACFNQWCEYAAVTGGNKADIAHAVKVLMNQLMHKGFTTWCENAYELGRARALVGGALKKMNSKPLLLAFNTWFNSVPQWREVDEWDAKAASDADGTNGMPLQHSTAFIARREKQALLFASLDAH